jgi:hypothetical protein
MQARVLMNLPTTCGRSLIPWPSAGKRSCWKKTEYSFDLAREKPQDIWANYDPEKARQGLRKSAGALKDVDHEALKKDIHSQRSQDSHGRPA